MVLGRLEILISKSSDFYYTKAACGCKLLSFGLIDLTFFNKKCKCKTYLEIMFQPEMNWDNYGNGLNKWQIDHVQPLCSFDLENRDQFLKANHFSNLRPMWGRDHVKKSAIDKKKSIHKKKVSK